MDFIPLALAKLSDMTDYIIVLYIANIIMGIPNHLSEDSDMNVIILYW